MFKKIEAPFREKSRDGWVTLDNDPFEDWQHTKAMHRIMDALNSLHPYKSVEIKGNCITFPNGDTLPIPIENQIPDDLYSCNVGWDMLIWKDSYMHRIQLNWRDLIVWLIFEDAQKTLTKILQDYPNFKNLKYGERRKITKMYQETDSVTIEYLLNQ